MIMRFIKKVTFLAVCAGIGVVIFFVVQYSLERKVLLQIIQRLQADSRIAEVIVTQYIEDPRTRQNTTTIKFLEYDAKGKPLTPQYFTFSGNILQFQSLVIRFEDQYIRNADVLRGKSIVLFWKVFHLAGKNTEEYEITKLYEIPQGYKIEKPMGLFEQKIWHSFWEYALNPAKGNTQGIKNLQIEAPGTKCIPGMLYTIKIEHDGGIRIDTAPLPSIVQGEYVPIEKERQPK